MTDARRYEVELKFPLAIQRDEVLAKLRVLGAKQAVTISQADRYFNHPQRDFAQSDEAFRIRSVGAQNFVTYKGPKIDTRTKTRQEIELPLGDGEALAEQFAELLTKLSFRPVATVRKQRDCWELTRGDWHFEVAIDDVEEVGTYLEIELVTDTSGLPLAQQAVLDLAAELGLREIEPHSYLRLLLKSRQALPEKSLERLDQQDSLRDWRSRNHEADAE